MGAGQVYHLGEAVALQDGRAPVPRVLRGQHAPGQQPVAVQVGSGQCIAGRVEIGFVDQPTLLAVASRPFAARGCPRLPAAGSGASAANVSAKLGCGNPANP